MTGNLLYFLMNHVVAEQSRKVNIWRKLHEAWRICLGGGKCSKIACLPACIMFWGCICYQAVGILVQTDANTNSCKCVNENLWPAVCRNFDGRHYIFQDDNAPADRSLFTVSQIFDPIP